MSSFLEKVAAARTQHQLAAEVTAAEQAKQNVEPPDAWVEQLRNIKGCVDEDNVERVSTVFLMEYLGVPPYKRLSLSKRLQKVMVNSLGWQPTRVFGLNERSYKEQLRGFARLVETDKPAGRFRLAAAEQTMGAEV